MATEIERKFLINPASIWKELEICETMRIIRQYYIVSSKEVAVRLRLDEGDNQAILAVKNGLDPMRMNEVEFKIPRNDYFRRLHEKTGFEISKTRYLIDFEGRTWEVDEFHGNLEGLMVAEIEADDAATITSFPHWVVEEVTYDTSFKNAVMAVNGRPKSVTESDRWAAFKLIHDERMRQIGREDWSADHDLEHRRGELMQAAIAYMSHDLTPAMTANGVPRNWPWDPKWFLPLDRKSNLIKAGSLALAEDERLCYNNLDGNVAKLMMPINPGVRKTFDMIIDELAKLIN